ncbi:MAG: hypothetical protein RMK89_12070 [Armatimonadota bacterium]|nr:hypothetical protein [Armatimonadota bacterium]MDW8144185.1 hypothetical protein [Armatimonadota bacterium]
MKVSRLIVTWVVLILMTMIVLPSTDVAKIIERLVKGVADESVIAELRSAIQIDPSAPSWWSWLGYAHSLRGEWDEAEKAYLKAQELKASMSFAWFPPTLPISWLPKHGNVSSLTINDLTVWQSLPVFYEPLFATDPKHGDRFHRVVFVHGAEGQNQFARNLVQWMIQGNELPQHIADAPSVFAASLRLFSERLGTPLRVPIKAWLFAKGNGSAFSFTGHTLFYGTIPSDRWAWWLKVAHEAGHHTVPAFGEFDGLHEPYSGGFLGERLFALWLWDEGRVTRDANELQQKLNEYLLKVVSAEIVRAQQWLLQNSESEKPLMQVFLGFCLYLERLGGYELLRDVMANSPNDSWSGFKIGLDRSFTERLRNGLKICLRVPDANTTLSTFDIAALRDGLKSQAIQIAWWLPKGEFQCEVEVEGSGNLQIRWGEDEIAELTFNSNERQKLTCTFVNQKSSWQRLRFWWLKGKGKILSVTFRRK